MLYLVDRAFTRDKGTLKYNVCCRHCEFAVCYACILGDPTVEAISAEGGYFFYLYCGSCVVFLFCRYCRGICGNCAGIFVRYLLDDSFVVQLQYKLVSILIGHDRSLDYCICVACCRYYVEECGDVGCCYFISYVSALFVAFCRICGVVTLCIHYVVLDLVVCSFLYKVPYKLYVVCGHFKLIALYCCVICKPTVEYVSVYCKYCFYVYCCSPLIFLCCGNCDSCGDYVTCDLIGYFVGVSVVVYLKHEATVTCDDAAFLCIGMIGIMCIARVAAGDCVCFGISCSGVLGCFLEGISCIIFKIVLYLVDRAGVSYERTLNNYVSCGHCEILAERTVKDNYVRAVSCPANKCIALNWRHSFENYIRSVIILLCIRKLGSAWGNCSSVFVLNLVLESVVIKLEHKRAVSKDSPFSYGVFVSEIEDKIRVLDRCVCCCFFTGLTVMLVWCGSGSRPSAVSILQVVFNGEGYVSCCKITDKLNIMSGHCELVTVYFCRNGCPAFEIIPLNSRCFFNIHLSAVYVSCRCRGSGCSIRHGAWVSVSYCIALAGACNVNNNVFFRHCEGVVCYCNVDGCPCSVVKSSSVSRFVDKSNLRSCKTVNSLIYSSVCHVRYFVCLECWGRNSSNFLHIGVIDSRVAIVGVDYTAVCIEYIANSIHCVIIGGYIESENKLLSVESVTSLFRHVVCVKVEAAYGNSLIILERKSYGWLCVCRIVPSGCILFGSENVNGICSVGDCEIRAYRVNKCSVFANLNGGSFNCVSDRLENRGQAVSCIRCLIESFSHSLSNLSVCGASGAKNIVGIRRSVREVAWHIVHELIEVLVRWCKFGCCVCVIVNAYWENCYTDILERLGTVYCSSCNVIIITTEVVWLTVSEHNNYLVSVVVGVGRTGGSEHLRCKINTVVYGCCTFGSKSVNNAFESRCTAFVYSGQACNYLRMVIIIIVKIVAYTFAIRRHCKLNDRDRVLICIVCDLIIWFCCFINERVNSIFQHFDSGLAGLNLLSSLCIELNNRIIVWTWNSCRISA